MKDIHDVITHAKFGDYRLRGSGVVAGQISAFPIDFAGRPYNTLTLPCERVMNSAHIFCEADQFAVSACLRFSVTKRKKLSETGVNPDRKPSSDSQTQGGT